MTLHKFANHVLSDQDMGYIIQLMVVTIGLQLSHQLYFRSSRLVVVTPRSSWMSPTFWAYIYIYFFVYIVPLGRNLAH
jgi:hypothetical protein